MQDPINRKTDQGDPNALNGLLSISGAQDLLRVLRRVPVAPPLRLERRTADAGLIHRLPPRDWLKAGGVPWRNTPSGIIYAAADPSRFARFVAALPPEFQAADIRRADRESIRQVIARSCRETLTQSAETRVAPVFSCRHLGASERARSLALAGLTAGAMLCALAGLDLSIAIMCLLALVLMLGITFLKLAGMIADVTARAKEPAVPIPALSLPRISVLVPLYDEPQIARTLLRRLKQVRYPRDRLDILLILEEDDRRTRAALADCKLPPWSRSVDVPALGQLRTKPRALNYALDFCEGDIIGIWDAEDAPDPDQLMKVAEKFACAAPDVACVQGFLDYYNTRANWMARCFTIEYAGWFRVVLPGLARMGMVIPLGGTTLFIRREILEELGGWDAHNVTEDADLGMRIARFGYRTEVVSSTTYEEANCRPWPWIKQRSRWLKGFMTTYIVHMRAPLRLLRELGWRRFIGVQAFFAGTLSQFLLAPVLWTYWAVLLGLDHPLTKILPGWALAGVTGLFLLSEAVNLTLGMIAAQRCGRTFLRIWVLSLPFYYPMGVIAAYKAAWELIRAPFYWDKTLHGVSPADGHVPSSA